MRQSFLSFHQWRCLVFANLDKIPQLKAIVPKNDEEKVKRHDSFSEDRLLIATVFSLKGNIVKHRMRPTKANIPQQVHERLRSANEAMPMGSFS